MWERLRAWWERHRRLGTYRKQLGDRGERVAGEHLQAIGLRILVRNWRNPQDQREEIDLVCAGENSLIFVEVKTRAPGALISGFHAVDRRKKKVLLRATRAYLRALGPSARELTTRFDIVEVEFPPLAPPIVRHYENTRLRVSRPQR